MSLKTFFFFDGELSKPSRGSLADQRVQQIVHQGSTAPVQSKKISLSRPEFLSMTESLGAVHMISPNSLTEIEQASTAEVLTYNPDTLSSTVIVAH